MLTNASLSQFQQQFETGLRNMLDADALGAFILVLANSMQDERLHAGLTPALREIFSELRDRYRNDELEGAPDDLAVFRSLAETGIDEYGVWQSRTLPPWRLAYNPLRALRPARASSDSFDSIRRPFNEQGFHFDKPFLKPEIMAEATYRGRPLRIMYHKFPFAPYHLMLVFEAANHLPQYLDGDDHALLWRLTEEAAENLPDIALAYNSLGAGASINHFHVHSMLESEPLAIEQSEWRHNGGEAEYPLTVEKFASRQEAGERLAELHEANQPFNLLYRPGCCYIAPRRPQGSFTAPPWMNTAAWYEVSGGFNLDDRNWFETLQADDIEAGLRLLAL